MENCSIAMIAAVVLSSLSAACQMQCSVPWAGSSVAEEAIPPVDDAPSSHSNILLISIDTLSPRMLGCYGYDRSTSPFIDKLAAEGGMFEAAYATSPWTLPSHASLLTGLYPRNHSLKSHRWKLPQGVVTLAGYLRSRGFVTAAVVNAHNVGQRYGLDRGFNQFELVPMNIKEIGPTAVEDRAHIWLDQVMKKPFFLFLHFYDIHSDYVSLQEYEDMFVSPFYDGPFDGTTRQLLSYWKEEIPVDSTDRQHLIDLYVSGIRQIDDGIERIFQHLEQLGLDETTLIVITSDHGEEFFEHGSVLHGRTQYEEVMRVPLIIRGPGVAAGRRIPGSVSLIDVMPSIVSYLGLPPLEGVDGLDVSLLWSGEDSTSRSPVRFIFGEADHNNEYEDMTRSVRFGRYKLILNRITGEYQLYDIEAGPRELEDMADAQPEVADFLLRQLTEFMKDERAGVELPTLSRDKREELEALGYLQQTR